MIEGLKVRSWDKWQKSVLGAVKRTRTRRKIPLDAPYSMSQVVVAAVPDRDFLEFQRACGRRDADALWLRVLQYVAHHAPMDGIVRVERRHFGRVVLSTQWDAVSRGAGEKTFDALVSSALCSELVRNQTRTEPEPDANGFANGSGGSGSGSGSPQPPDPGAESGPRRRRKRRSAAADPPDPVDWLAVPWPETLGEIAAFEPSTWAAGLRRAQRHFATWAGRQDVEAGDNPVLPQQVDEAIRVLTTGDWSRTKSRALLRLLDGIARVSPATIAELRP